MAHMSFLGLESSSLDLGFHDLGFLAQMFSGF